MHDAASPAVRSQWPPIGEAHLPPEHTRRSLHQGLRSLPYSHVAPSAVHPCSVGNVAGHAALIRPASEGPFPSAIGSAGVPLSDEPVTVPTACPPHDARMKMGPRYSKRTDFIGRRQTQTPCLPVRRRLPSISHS